jgi:carbohydrate kinase (thermoresistant glucokinase family)
MSAGTPLTDEDRWPWLRDIAAWTNNRAAEGVSTVVTCSALRRVYRNLLREPVPSTFFVHLDAPENVLLERMGSRKHYMPASLLRSQLETLEQLDPDEAGVCLDTQEPKATVVADAVAAVRVATSRT